MRREVRLLKQKAIDSLVLGIELFNRPREDSRVEGVLIHADRAFELLLKSVIRHRGGAIREPGDPNTIGFRACVNKCLSDAALKCLNNDQAITLHALNGWRGAAQHYIVIVSEQQLYLACQAAVTLFNDLLGAVFGESLRDYVPDRVLPVSTSPPRDLDLFLDDDMSAIKTLLRPGSRQMDVARARLRPIAILEGATLAREVPPSDEELDRLLGDLRVGRAWREVFPGVAHLQLATEGSGLTYSLRLSKSEGFPVKLVNEAESEGNVVAVRKVSELGFYSLGFADVASHLADLVTRNKLLAVIEHLKLQEDEDCFKVLVVGHLPHKLYSQEALKRLRAELSSLDIDAIWDAAVRARRERRYGR